MNTTVSKSFLAAAMLLSFLPGAVQAQNGLSINTNGLTKAELPSGYSSTPLTKTVIGKDGVARQRTIFTPNGMKESSPFVVPQMGPRAPAPPVTTAVFDPSCAYTPFYQVIPLVGTYTYDDNGIPTGCEASTTSLGVISEGPNQTQFGASWDFNYVGGTVPKISPKGAFNGFFVPAATYTLTRSAIAQFTSQCSVDAGPIIVDWSTFQLAAPDPARNNALALAFAINANIYFSAYSDETPTIVAQYYIFLTDWFAEFAPSSTVYCPGSGTPVDPGDPIDPGDGGGLVAPKAPGK